MNNIAFYEELASKCEDLDLSIVIANAGVMTVGNFEKFPGKVCQEMIDVNAY